MYATGNSEEEFWVCVRAINKLIFTRISDQFSNVPDKYLTVLPNGTTYGKGSFREARLLVDGQLAGVAFPYIAIYTGGIVPAAWR